MTDNCCRSSSIVTARCGSSDRRPAGRRPRSAWSARPTTAWSTGSPPSSSARCCSTLSPRPSPRPGRLARRPRPDGRRAAWSAGSRDQAARRPRAPVLAAGRADLAAPAPRPCPATRCGRAGPSASARAAPPGAALNPPILAAAGTWPRSAAAGRPAQGQGALRRRPSTTSCWPPRRAPPATSSSSAAASRCRSKTMVPVNVRERRRRRARQPHLVHVRRPAVRRARPAHAPVQRQPPDRDAQAGRCARGGRRGRCARSATRRRRCSACSRTLSPARASFNLVVSNIPGPRIPLYLRGCRLEEAYPVVPLAERHAVSIGMTTDRRRRAASASTPTARRCPTPACWPSAWTRRSTNCWRWSRAFSARPAPCPA